MKRFKKYGLLLILAAVSALMINSCSESNNPAGGMGAGAEMEYIAYDGFDEATFQDATMESEPMLLTPESDEYCMYADDNRRGKQKMQRPDRRPPVFEFMRVFRAMELTDEQKAELRPFFEAHFACASDLLLTLRESERAIIQSAREERQSIMAQFRAGELTREEAIAELRQLNLRTKQALLENPEREAAREALKECRDLLLENIASILTEEQLLIWEEWLAEREG